MTGFVIIFSILLVLAAGLLFGARYAYKVCFMRHGDGKADPYGGLDRGAFVDHADEVRGLIDRLVATPFEEIRISSRDGLSLYGRYYHQKDGAPIHLYMHGYRSTPLRDFAKSGCAAIDGGYNLLLVDQRAHGESEGEALSFGINERYDCLLWAEYLAKRFPDSKIILHGISMGGATVLMASELPLPKEVACIISDCPYSSPKEIIIRVTDNTLRLPGRLLFPVVWLGARIFGKFSVTAATPERAVKSASIPILLIHGDADDFVPTYMSEVIYKSIPDGRGRLVKIPDADHAVAAIVGGEEYRRLMHEFIESAILEKGDKQ